MPSLGQPIALGRTAEVYRWEEKWVLKLFRPPWSRPASVDREARIARTVHATGLPVPSVGGVVEINGRLGPVIIDWVDATRGTPLGDIARTSLLLHLGAAGRSALQRWWAAVLLGGFRRAYLTRSVERCPGGTAGLASWEGLVAAARLSEQVAGERERLLRIISRTANRPG